MQRLAVGLRRQGSVGFVPTMGALHAGHIALVRRAVELCDRVVVSIFVNPTQFGPAEDFRRYPRRLRHDLRLLSGAGCDVVFCPDVRGMYPDGYATFVEVERLTQHLCGARRPGHFRGVATVVAKLLNIVRPDVTVFGQKDAQQVQVIRRMVRDLSFPVRVVVVPTVREADGLAMSSRNAYLSPEERKQATVLYRGLVLARHMVRSGERDAARIRAAVRRLVEGETSGRVDYIELVDAEELKPRSRLEGRVLVALAVWFRRARLIDNMTIRVGVGRSESCESRRRRQSQSV